MRFGAADRPHAPSSRGDNTSRGESDPSMLMPSSSTVSTLATGLWWAAMAVAVGASAAEHSVPLQAPPGFEVALYADDDLAHDIHALTIDSLGRVVVSGPGYVRILIDRDGDGRADEARTFAEPLSGTQGMFFHGRDLLCTVEGGLVRYRDRDGNDRADGPPQVFLRLKTGGEHDAHALRRGPDGWWYLIVGNSGGVTQRYITTATSPVAEPRAGTILRLSPDLASGEVFAHGLRNAYDFTFDAVGELFTCDSDGEREVSLPWYLPCRTLQVLPGMDAGWVSESWKRQDHFFDMPPVVAALGRGSPTGVVCYRHVQFPPEYHSALFVLDWTYGRVYALRPRQQGAGVVAEPVEFLTGTVGYGFAPTSAAVGPDGSLFISVGGRGTRGGVYRVRAQGRTAVNPLEVETPTTPDERLTFCLRCPEPLSSWSRRLWEPLAAELGSEPFIRAAQEESRPAVERLRALEILTEKFHGLDGDLLEVLIRAPQPAVRVRAAWSIGRTQTEYPRTTALAQLLQDDEPFVVRTALEALLGARPEALAELVEPLAQCLAAADPWVRQAAVRVVRRADEETWQAIAAAAAPAGWQAGLSLAAVYAQRHPGPAPYTVEIALRILAGPHPLELKRQAARLLQIGLGDCGPATEGPAPRPPVFDGYASRADLTQTPELREEVRTALSRLYPQGDALLDRELARVIAMVQPDDSALVDKLLAAITADSHPVDDLHQLIVMARLPGPRTQAQRDQIAAGLLGIEPKLQSRRLVQDSHWNDRVLEMYAGLVDADPELPAALLAHPAFGRPAHAQFLSLLPPSFFDRAVSRFARAAIEGGEKFAWNEDVIYLLAQSEDEQVRNLVRAQFDHFGLRAAVLLALAEHPREGDRELFIAGLEESSLEVLEACLRALALLPAGESADENVALLRTLRRLGFEGRERKLRDQAAELLRRNTRRDIPYQLGRDGDPQQAAIDAWTKLIAELFPQEYARQSSHDHQEQINLEELLARVPWEEGDAARGQLLFQRRACQQCHGSSRALGPDLRGAASRFSRDDLFAAIVFPSRDVSPRYQSELIVTRDGQSYSGLVVYEAVDGLVLRDAQNRTWRLEAADIEARRRLPTSLMPSGLLKDLAPADLADLYAYLRSLAQQPVPRTAREERIEE